MADAKSRYMLELLKNRTISRQPAKAESPQRLYAGGSNVENGIMFFCMATSTKNKKIDNVIIQSIMIFVMHAKESFGSTLRALLGKIILKDTAIISNRNTALPCSILKCKKFAKSFILLCHESIVAQTGTMFGSFFSAKWNIENLAAKFADFLLRIFIPGNISLGEWFPSSGHNLLLSLENIHYPMNTVKI